MTPPSKKLLVCHGLNLKPAKMEPLSSIFEKLGFVRHTIILKGHNPSDSLDDFRNVSAEKWRAEFLAAFLNPERAPGPLATLTFSLGAACYLAALSRLWRENRANYREPDFHVLLAPALATHFWTRATKILGGLPRFVIPSASPKHYRCHRGTPVAAYSALFDLMEEIGTAAKLGFRLNNPVLLIINPKDELVSLRNSAKLLDILTNGRYEPLHINNVNGRIRPKYAHLVLDPDCLGEIQFQIVADRIQSFVAMG
jgi:hypothetical protein